MLNLKTIAHYVMIKRITICALIVFMLIWKADNTLAGEPMRLSESDSGKVIQIFVGDELEVVLPGNPTTGYVWDVSSLDSHFLTQAKTDFIANDKAIGSGGMEVLRFKAIAAGRSEVKLIFHRPFERNVRPAKTFDATVIIKNE